MTDPMQTEREAFEAWAQSKGMDVQRFSDDYLYTETKSAWLGWIGRAESPELRSLRDALALARSHIGELEDQLMGYLDGLKFHPSASHVHPEYRDGFNHAINTVSDRIRTERTLRARAALKEKGE